MLIPGNEIESPSTRCGLGTGEKDQDSANLRNLTKPAAILSCKVFASRNMT